MPALRSLSALTIAACLAQAWAGPSENAVERRNGGWGGSDGGDYSQGRGWGGDGGWQDQDMNPPSDQSKNQEQPQVLVTVTETMMMTVTAPAPVQGNVEVQTVTVTAVAPCDANVVTATAYVTTCPMAPAPAVSSSCMPCGAMSWPAVPANAGGLGNCPVWTTAIPDFAPGLSSIPVEQAVVTGVAKAAGPPAGAPAEPAKSGPPEGAPAPAPTVSLVPAAPLMAGRWSSGGGGGMWGVPGAYSASGAGAWTMFLGSTFTTTGTVVPGMSNIPNTMVDIGAGAVPLPSAEPSVLPGVFASGAAPEVPPGTTTSTTTKSTETVIVSSSSTMTSIPQDTVAAVSAASATPMTAISYGNSGMLGIGKRSMVPRPTAWS